MGLLQYKHTGGGFRLYSKTLRLIEVDFNKISVSDCFLQVSEQNTCSTYMGNTYNGKYDVGCIDKK